MCRGIIQLREDLRAHASQKRKQINQKFFKTKSGEYGAHDKFLGVRNPDIRSIAKRYNHCTLNQLQKLIESSYNEERLCALIILVNNFSLTKTNKSQRDKIFNFYLKNIDQVNNWNLVDLSAHHILGEYLTENEDMIHILDKLVISKFQWHRRICIVSTWAFIKRDKYEYTLRYAKKLFSDKEDLMHKATGWMLREVWKKDQKTCERFLQENYSKTPRTTLRYAIERMDEHKRQSFLQHTF
jgi:3-methyladenine DNA glycosylase AlkD